MSGFDRVHESFYNAGLTVFSTFGSTDVVIFAKSDEVSSGITDFAEEYEISSASLTAVGALRSAVTGWFEVSKQMYKLNPVNEQV